MNVMNDERFSDLAMKVIAQQATPAERAELDAALAGDPARKAEFGQWQAQAALARELMPLVNSMDATGGERPAYSLGREVGELPEYALGRLQTKVRETLGRPAAESRSKGWGWRLFLVLTPATAVIIGLLSVVMLKPTPPVFQVALLDATGPARGAETNDLALFTQHWKAATVQSFVRPADLETWEKGWPAGKGPAVKIVYDRTAAELRVVGRWQGRDFQKTFLVERGLAAALGEADAFVKEQMK